MSEQEQKKLIEYIIACISEFADYHALSLKESFNYLYRFKGISFLTEHYNIEHTLSIEDAIDDLTLICKNNGYSLDEAFDIINKNL